MGHETRDLKRRETRDLNRHATRDLNLHATRDLNLHATRDLKRHEARDARGLLSLVSCLLTSLLASSHLSFLSLVSCLLSSALLLPAFAGENLIPEGTFNDIDEKSIGRVCRGEDGPAKLFTEDATWNRCCKAEVGPVRKDGPNKEYRSRAATVSFGRVGDEWGFPVKPDTTYEYSVDLRKGAGIKGVGIVAVALNKKGDFWGGREYLKTTGGHADLQDEWSNVRGTFKTGPATKRVILNVHASSTTHWSKTIFADGSYFLVDNVKVEESSRNLGSAPAKASVPVRKAVRAGESFADFELLHTVGRAPTDAKTTVSVVPGESAFLVTVDCRESKKVVPGVATEPWEGDHCEIWFGSTAPDRVSTQVAVGAAGGLYVAKESSPCTGHGVTATAAADGGGWRAQVAIPYALLSLKGAPREGAALPFNVGRYRVGARVYSTWSALKEGFNDTANFGTLVIGSYSAALAAKYGAGKTATDRADYEAKVAAEETAKLQAKFDRFAKQKMSVAPVSPIGDFSIPYLPAEIFDPPAEIRLTAAVNEKKALPIAVANLSARVEDYLVLLESLEPGHDQRNNVWQWTGNRGLKGFPESQVTFRKAVRMKDVSTADPTLRFDPLPEADGCCSLTVAPKEAALVWFDFDTTDVKPGTYRGRLRVIPTCEAGNFKRIGKSHGDIGYTGEMRVIPVTLEVVDVTLPKNPRRPSGFFQGMNNESCYRLAKDLGAEQFLVSPWSFYYERKKDGTIDLDDPKGAAGAVQQVSRQVEIARKYGRPVKFLVCYSIVHTFHQLYWQKFPDRETEGRVYQQYVKGIAKVFEKCGLTLDDYSLETYDEPPADKVDEILWYHRLAKEAVPGIRIEITLGSRMMKPDELEQIAAFTDEWIVWDAYFSHTEYAALFARLQKRGAKVMHYQCDTSPRTVLHDYYRKKTWFGEFYGLDGNCMYQLYDHQGGTGARDFKSCTEGGFIYFLYGEAVPSIRSMAWREGATDMQYVAALERATGNSEETKAYVAEAAKRVMRTKRFDATEPDRIRAEIIARLTGKKSGAK